jgi:hypothetical protein
MNMTVLTKALIVAAQLPPYQVEIVDALDLYGTPLNALSGRIGKFLKSFSLRQDVSEIDLEVSEYWGKPAIKEVVELLKIDRVISSVSYDEDQQEWYREYSQQGVLLLERHRAKDKSPRFTYLRHVAVDGDTMTGVMFNPITMEKSHNVFLKNLDNEFDYTLFDRRSNRLEKATRWEKSGDYLTRYFLRSVKGKYFDETVEVISGNQKVTAYRQGARQQNIFRSDLDEDGLPMNKVVISAGGRNNKPNATFKRIGSSYVQTIPGCNTTIELGLVKEAEKCLS